MCSEPPSESKPQTLLPYKPPDPTATTAPPKPPAPSTDSLYTVFTPREKRLLTLLLGLTTITSPLTATILLSPPSSPQRPLPRLGPSDQPYHNHLHHLSGPFSCHFRHALRLPRSPNHISSHSHPLRAVELGPRTGT